MRLSCLLAVLLISPMLAVGNARAGESLRHAADKIRMLAGTAVNPDLFSNSDYTTTLARQYNMVEAENAMKWRATEPSRGVFDFRAGDRIVAFARAHGMKVRGHNLLWGKYNPAWLVRGHFRPAELSRIMKNHIQMVVRHYRGQVFAWDVVNEAFDSEGHLRHTIWYDEPGIGLGGKGTAYIAQVFRWAHQADPQALLFYNDYAADGINAKSDAICEMVKDFKRQGVPINGVGLQTHVFNRNGVPSHLTENIAVSQDSESRFRSRKWMWLLRPVPKGKYPNPNWCGKLEFTGGLPPPAPRTRVAPLSRHGDLRIDTRGFRPIPKVNVALP